MTRRHFKIYHSRWHLVSTLLILIIPFIFLLIFAKFTNFTRTQLLFDVGISFVRLVFAYIFSVILAWAWGVWCYKSKLTNVLLPVFDVLQSFPTFAALPLATLLWGRSDFTIVLFLVFTIVWPIFFSVVSSLKLVKKEWEEAIEIYQVSGKEYLTKFLLPVSIPGIITGSIIGLGEGWEALVATEMIVGIQSGLGSFFQIHSQNVQITLFGVIGFLLLIFSLNKIIWLPLMEWSHKYIEE